MRGRPSRSVATTADAAPRPPARDTDAVGGRTWSAIVILGLVGQLAWTVENMYLNVFVYETISPQPWVTATMVALSAVAATIGALLVGAWSDRLGRRRVFVAVGYLAWGACTTAFGVVGQPGASEAAVVGAIAAIVLLDCVMSFFGSGANDAAFNAWVTDSSTPRNRGRIDGVLAVLPLIAMLLVFGVLDGLTRSGDWTAFFAIVGVVTSAAGLLSLALMRDRPLPKADRSVLGAIVDAVRPRSIRRHPSLYLTLVILAAIGTSSQVFLPYVIIYLQRYLRIESYALALGIVLLLASAASVAGGRIMDRMGKRRFLLPAVGVFAAGLLAMLVAREFWWVVGAATVMMAGMMASLATVNAMTRDRTPPDQVGAVQGVRMILGVMVPMIIGPAIGAAVISGAANTYVELGVARPVPGPEIFGAAAAVLTLVPLLLILSTRKERA